MMDSPRQDLPARDCLLHVADLHFWKVTFNPLRLLNKRVLGNLNVWMRRRHEFAMERAAACVDWLAAQGTRQLLLTGDFTSTALDEEFERAREFVVAVRQRGFTVYMVPGNHDVYTFESVRKDRFRRYFGDYIPAQGYPARYTLPGGTPLLLVPTACPNLLSTRGRIRDVEVQRTADLLRECGPAVIVAGHYPVLNKTPGYELTRSRRLRNAEALRSVLGRSEKRILYVAGHVHRFSYVTDEKYPHLQHVTTGALFYRNRREGHEAECCQIEVGDEGFRVHRKTRQSF